MATQDQIDSFYRFASEQLNNGGANLSMAELFDTWQVQNPTADELTESVAAVKVALADMENGDTGRPFEEFRDEMRRQFNVPAD